MGVDERAADVILNILSYKISQQRRLADAGLADCVDVVQPVARFNTKGCEARSRIRLASLSSFVLEHALARGLLAAPSHILLRTKKQNSFERAVGRFVVGRYYAPFPDAVREKIWNEAVKALGCPRESLADPDAAFQVAYSDSRKSEDASNRVDGFRNQYGFCRNIAFVALISAIALIIFEPAQPPLWAVSALVAIGMTLRFLKFYSAFAAEVLRALVK